MGSAGFEPAISAGLKGLHFRLPEILSTLVVTRPKKRAGRRCDSTSSAVHGRLIPLVLICTQWPSSFWKTCSLPLGVMNRILHSSFLICRESPSQQNLRLPVRTAQRLWWRIGCLRIFLSTYTQAPSLSLRVPLRGSVCLSLSVSLYHTHKRENRQEQTDRNRRRGKGEESAPMHPRTGAEADAQEEPSQPVRRRHASTW